MYDDLFPINWSDFHFLRPQFLWLLVVVFVLVIISLLSMRQEMKWKKIIAPHLRKYTISKGSNIAKFWMHLVLLFTMVFGILALAGPTWKKVKIPGQKLETPVVVLLDLSQSMMAEDIQPNRLERAKFKIQDLIKYNPRARMALVAFAGTAHTVVPLTKDYEIIKSHVEGLRPSTMPFSGSNLQAALQLGDSLTQVTKAPGTLVVISDDFGNEEISILTSFVSNSKNKIIILPMNTPSGGEIPAPNGKYNLKDKNGKIVRSSIDPNIISILQEVEKVDVQHLTLDDSDVEFIAKKISENLVFTSKAEEKEDVWRDVGLLLVIPMAICLLFWYRKGWVLYTLGFLLLCSCNSENSFSDIWFTKDYQGQRLSDAENYKNAAETYSDPLRKGIAYFKANNYESAISAFAKDTTAEGAYNLGLAYFKNGDYAAAQFAFGLAVEKDPNLTAARQNSNALEKLLPATDKMTPKNAEESQEGEQAKNMQNKDMEDLSGGGQEATKEDMKKERKEETVNTSIRKGKELDEVPENIEASVQKPSKEKVLMRKVNDDPALFLQRKFKYQAKKYNMKPQQTDGEKW
ncbi:vWA domain-containing protein [Mesonia aquimarina]|uniref:vWA domain-containing protein n=1 Tax=Mesonia aquimarina TaxID=1504967 RepID=UPI000EF5DFB4|nr:VWA domain-containing protein [Mesonia aquimarina]